MQGSLSKKVRRITRGSRIVRVGVRTEHDRDEFSTDGEHALQDLARHLAGVRADEDDVAVHESEDIPRSTGADGGQGSTGGDGDGRVSRRTGGSRHRDDVVGEAQRGIVHGSGRERLDDRARRDDGDLDPIETRMLGGGKLAMATIDAVPAGKYGKAALEKLQDVLA